MICRLASRLFRLMPWTPWQAMLIRLHIGRCPRCGGEFEIDEELKRLTLKPGQTEAGPDLWADVRLRLQRQSQGLSDRLKRWLKTFESLFFLFGILLLILFIFLAFYFKFFEK